MDYFLKKVHLFQLLFLVLFSLFVLFIPATNAKGFDSGLKQNKFYVSIGAGVIKPVNKMATSSVAVTSVVGQTTNYQYTNNKSDYGMTQSVGWGYQRFLIHHPLSWRIGMRLTNSTTHFLGNGTTNLLPGEQFDYQYDVDIVALSTIARMTYWQRSWGYYIEGNIGIGYVNTNNYSASVGYDSTYANQVHYEPILGGALGFVYALTANSDIDTAIGYQDEGMAKLGTRNIANSSGTIDQRVQTVTVTLRFTQYF